MKKNYEKPELEAVDFKILNNIMDGMGGVTDTSQGVEDYDPNENPFG